MVASRLAKGSGGDYGVHSEMFTTGLMLLHQAGKVTNAAKGILDGVSVTTSPLERRNFTGGSMTTSTSRFCRSMSSMIPR